MIEPTIFELSRPNRKGIRFPAPDVPLADLPKEFLRKELPLPEVPETNGAATSPPRCDGVNAAGAPVPRRSS